MQPFFQVLALFGNNKQNGTAPVDTRRRFNVDTTSYDVVQHRIDIETTSCVYWDWVLLQHIGFHHTVVILVLLYFVSTSIVKILCDDALLKVDTRSRLDRSFFSINRSRIMQNIVFQIILYDRIPYGRIFFTN